MGRFLRQHADDLTRRLALSGADGGRYTLAILFRNSHHQIPDAPPPPDDPPPPEKPPPPPEEVPLLELPELRRIFNATFSTNQRNPGKTMRSAATARRNAKMIQLVASLVGALSSRSAGRG